MKFTLLATATLAIAGMASAAAVHPSEYCEEYHIASAGESCQDLAKKFNVSPQVFEIYNHGLTTDACAALVEGEVYCVKAPKTKAKRCLAEQRKAAAKKAAEEAAAKKAAEEAAAKKAAEEAAKKAEEAAQKTEEPAPTTGSRVGIPASQAGGLRIVNRADPNCKTYYVVTDADTCYDVAQDFGITTAQLYSYNKNLHSQGIHECDNFDTGKAYCVAV